MKGVTYRFGSGTPPGLARGAIAVSPLSVGKFLLEYKCAMFLKSVTKLSYIEGVGGRLYLKASARPRVQIFTDIVCP